MSVTTMQYPQRQRRASSSASAAATHRSERRQSGRNSDSADRQARAYARPGYVSRKNSEANLYTLHQGGSDDVLQDTSDANGRPPMSPRKLSQASKISLASYETKFPFTDASYNVNIAVLGNTSVGKSTFIQKTLDLDHDELAGTPSRILSMSGNLCMVRMFEMSLDEVYRGEDDTLKWPRRLSSTPIHGAMTLYDVGNKASFKLVPEVLNAINKMSLPSVLAACKCDIANASRQLEPRTIEQRVTSAFDRITTLQTSESSTQPFRKAISTILNNVVNTQDPLDSTGPNRRTTTNAASLPSSPVSPRRPPPPMHSRSSNEVLKSRRHDSAAHPDSSRKASIATSKATSVSSYVQEGSFSSFLADESSSDEAHSQTSLSAQETDASDAEAEAKSVTPRPRSEEPGWTFDALVNRLLALPKSKADSKFATVFLALYRKFAPPGQLLEAIVVRFEEMEHDEPVMLTRTIAQLRYLTIVEQWIHLYPGDFAHAKTLRRIRTFICKLQKNQIFATAAQEMNNNLGYIAEDDDTEWAYCDRDRKEQDSSSNNNKWTYRGSLLIDDPSFKFPDAFGNLSLSPPGQLHNSPIDPVSPGSALRQANIKFEDIAQREASKLVPSPRNPMTKSTWRALLDIPNDQIARELTRIDWIMFSSIRPRDLVRHVSLSASAKIRCKSLANVSRMIDHFNHLRDFTINYILYRDKPKHRAQMLEKFIAVARALRELNNYNSLGAVLAGIHSTPVQRLTATLDLLSADSNRDCMKLEILMAQTKSFGSYRLAWENTTTSRIPYLPLPIRDLVGAESGNSTFIGRSSDVTPANKGAQFVSDDHEDASIDHVSGKRINWSKFEIMGDVLVGIQRAQGVPYRSAILGPRNEEVRGLVLNTRIERDEEALHTRSLALEGNGEKMGFIKGFLKR